MCALIRKASHKECLPLRHKVLWPGLDVGQCYVDGDEEADHYVMERNGSILSCLSVFSVDNGIFKIRKFATDFEYQGMGYGSQLLAHAIKDIKRKGAKKVILSARESASSFYKKFGFVELGNKFNRKDISFTEMSLSVLS